MQRFAAVAFLFALVALTPGMAQDLSFGSLEARPAPRWLNKASIYEVWLNVFSKEGNLRGAIPGLQHVADLGATIVYLGPIARRSSVPNASPYSIANYSAIDPEAGTAQDLRDFVLVAHRLHLKVMLDIVYYHTAPDHVMMGKDASFFVRTPEGRQVQGFWPQPLPDFTNPQVRQYLIESLVYWVREFDVDGFRCDVGGGVPIAFWNEARLALDGTKPEIVMLSESDRPDDQLKAFDMNYNFDYYLTLRSVLRDGAPALRLREQWERMHTNMPHGARLLHYSDNHDWPRAVLQFGERGALVASVLNFTLDGVPFAFNGQEIDDPMPTVWRRAVPIIWPHGSDENDQNQDAPLVVEGVYNKLFHLRATEAALSDGSVIWVNNDHPESALTFLRRAGEDEVLVMLNFSNRDVKVTMDLPVMDYYKVENLLSPGLTWFSLYSGRVSSELPAFGYVVGRKVPLAPLIP